MKKSEKEKADALDQLRKWIKPGDKVYTVLRHVSRSGMQREIGVVVFVDGEALHPNYSVSKALGWRQGKRDGVIVRGCGMDMGAHLVQTLSYIMFPTGFGCIGEGCPSSDHSNGDRDYTPHYDGTPRNADEVGKDLKPYPHYHKDGGYALRQVWL